ncbi:MAG: glycosyltransferase family 39 protein [bacterium]
MSIIDQPPQQAELEGESVAELDPRWIVFLLLGLILIFSLALRYYRIEESFGGFLSFNEAWYATIARNYENHSLLYPTSIFGTTDYNVAPFYSYLLHAAKGLLSESERNYRLVSVLFSEISIVLIFLLGSVMFSSEAGLVAAALYGFAPVSVVVGRNVQTDAVYLAFLLASLYFYLLAGRVVQVRSAECGVRNGEFGMRMWHPQTRLGVAHRLMALSGLCFGFAFFTKQFAVLFVPALFVWECIRSRGIRRLGVRHLWFTICAIAVPAPFFIYHLVIGGGAVFRAQSALAGSEFALPNLKEAAYLWWEYFWGFSPIIFLLCSVGVIYGIIRRGSYRIFLLLAFAVFIVFFAFWHGHSYYILYAVPFAALLAGDVISLVRRKGVLILFVVVVCSVSAVHTIAFLCNVKYGYNSFSVLGESLNGGKGTTLILSPGADGNYRPLVHYYLPEAEILTEQELERKQEKKLGFLKGKNVFVISLAGRPVQDFPMPSIVIKRQVSTLVLFGIQIYVVSESEHFFRAVRAGVVRSGRWYDAGVLNIGFADDLLLSPLTPAARYRLQYDRVIYY